jgi:hypothetical protein
MYPNGINYSPGAFNPSYNLPNDPTDVLKPINTGANPDAGLKILEWFTQWIKSAFFVDLFLALMDKTKRMSIPEVQEIVSEKMLVLGSSIENVMNDFLEPNIELMYNELARRGMLPPVPEAMKGTALTIEYISPLAKAQKALRAGAMQNLMLIIGNMMNINPTISDNFDMDVVARHLHDSFDAPLDILNSGDEVKDTRQKRAEAQAAMIQREQGEAEANTDEKKAKAELNRRKAEGVV